MDSLYQSRLDLFVGNYHEAKAGFFWKNTLSKRLAALLFAAENRAFDARAIRQSEALIKENTGLFSSFRGNSVLTVATLLALGDEPRERFKQTLLVYDLMKASRFYSSDYLVVAACLIASQAEPGRFAQIVSKAKAFYDAMKSAHWFLTGQDDHIYAAMFGLSDLDVQNGIDQMEVLYQDLKVEFYHKNSLQAMATVLMLGGKDRDAVRRVSALKQAFRDRQLKMDQQYTLSSLGVLSLLPQDDLTIVDTVKSTYDYLRSKPGFGPWSVSKQELLLYSAALFAFVSADQINKGLLAGTISTSIASIIIAQQTAAVIASTSAASAAASSASN